MSNGITIQTRRAAYRKFSCFYTIEGLLVFLYPFFCRGCAESANQGELVGLLDRGKEQVLDLRLRES